MSEADQSGAADRGFPDAASDAVAWLSLGRDVLLCGDTGSGRSTVIDSVMGVLTRRRANALLLRASGVSTFASLLAHPSAPTVSGPAAIVEATLVGWLVSELTTPRSYLLADDVDRMDDGSVAVIEHAVRRTGARLLLSASRDLTGLATSPLGTLVTERAPAEVRTRAMGYLAMSDLAAHRLGGPAEVGLVATITARAAGNPRVAEALIDGARFAGVFAEVDGVWSKVGSMDAVPMEAVAHGLLAHLPPEEVRALEVLSWSGPITVARATEIHPSEVWQSLAVKHRAVLVRAGWAPAMIAVSPPALAQAIRARLSRYRREEIAALIGVTGDVDPLVLWCGIDGPSQMLTDTTNLGSDEFWQRSTELDGLVQEKSETVEAVARATWQLHPDLPNANRYLSLLMRRPTSGEVIRTVLVETEVGDRDAPGERALFALLRERWLQWTGAVEADDSGEDGLPHLTPGSIEAHVAEQAFALRGRLLAQIAAGAPRAVLLGDDAPTFGQAELDGWAVVARTALLLEAGLLDLAAELCEREDPRSPRSQHYMDALRGLILLAGGETGRAETWERTLLDRAYENLDVLGVRAHTCVLAEILAFQGQTRAAWMVVAASLRLGPAGMLETTFYRRLLSLGAMLRVRASDLATARRLLAELDRTPADHQPTLNALAAPARAVFAEMTHAFTDADHALWQEGRRLADEGLNLAALQHWALHPGPLGDEQVAELRALFDARPVPLLAPYVELHEAIAHRDEAAARHALRHVQPDLVPGPVRTAAELFAGIDVPDPGAAPLGARRRAYLDALSRRERQIAAMARDGSSNRDIARQLDLSLRTVENHMSHILAKLNLSSRTELPRIPEG